MRIRVLLLTFLTLMYSISSIADVKVIANGQVKETELSKRDLRSIFTMKKKRWSDGNEISVFVLSDKHPLHSSFSKEILKTYPYHLRKIWDRQVYSGTGNAPIQLTSEQEMLETIKGTPYAIGYINKTDEIGLVKVILRN